MTLAANPPVVALLAHGGRAVLERARARLRGRRAAPVPGATEAVFRALCHDMRSPLASLESLLGALERSTAGPDEVLDLARAQTAHLSSMLRTADASGEAPPPPRTTRRLVDVVRSSVAASGLPPAQVGVRMRSGAAEVSVGDARVQRILLNLLENAHRHGGGAPVELVADRRPGWVDLALSQAGVPVERVVGHLAAARPPVDLTGLGLWSVQRQTHELGGRVTWHVDGDVLTLVVRLPDR